MTETSQLNNLEAYIPSSSEKKQAVLMYMAVGLVLSLGKREVSHYTHHHIKQSLGWFVFFMLVLFMDVLLFILGLIIHFFRGIAVFISIPTLTIGFMGLYQAKQGKYIWESEGVNKFFGIFSGIGNWVLNLFDMNHYSIINADNYRSENQFFGQDWSSQGTSTENSTQTGSNTINLDSLGVKISDNLSVENSVKNGNSLDKSSQISINNGSIGIDLSNHEINKPNN